MPRSRGSEMPPRLSPQASQNQVRKSNSDPDPLRHNHRPTRERRSPTFSDHRVSQSDSSSNQKKLGTRIADLESQLGQAQEELKVLKDQLASAEAARREAQQELEIKNVKKQEGTKEEKGPEIESPKSSDKLESDHKINEVNLLKLKLEDNKKENEKLKNDASLAQAREEEVASRLRRVEHELEESKVSAALLNENLKMVEGAKEGLELEMKKMRVQTEQWRKAADAAAAVLAGGGGMEMISGRGSERCGSMDKQFEDVFVGPDEFDDGFGGGKRKGSSGGIKMFGDLWKRKNQK